MKILFIVNELGHGGRERRLTQLIRELDTHKSVEMMIATTCETIEYTEVNDTSAVIRFMKNGSLSAKYKELKNLFEVFKPDIVHLWVETALFCVAVPILAGKYNCKYIAGFVADGNSLSGLPLYQRLAIRFTFRRADAVISNSRAGLLAKGAPLKKSHVVYNGFDPKRLAIVSKEEKRKELGIKGSWLVVMCGRMDDAKDWTSFVNLAERLSKIKSDVYFLGVAGRGGKVDYYREMIESKGLGNISFVTCRKDVMEIFAVTDVSVLFTNSEVHAEGVSNAIMEAMAAGVPVIATEGGGTDEIINTGEDGFIIDPMDVEMACSRLVDLIENDELRKTIGERAASKVKERFALSTMGKGYEGIYNDLLNK